MTQADDIDAVGGAGGISDEDAAEILRDETGAFKSEWPSFDPDMYANPSPLDGVLPQQTIVQEQFKSFMKESFKLTPATMGYTITRGWWIPAKHLMHLSTVISTEIAKGNGRIIVMAPPRHGKALRHGTLIHTPAGLRPIEDLRIGDEVIAKTGVNKVLAVYPQGKVQLYKMTLSDNSEVECCAEHIWHVREVNTSHVTKWKNLSLKDIMAKPLRMKHGRGAYRNRFHIPAVAVEGEELNLPIKPYTLGALIGDGSMVQHPKITCHIDDIATLDHIRADGYELGVGYEKNNVLTHQLLDKPALVEALTELGLYGHKSPEKFIPPVYFSASIHQRIALLQGLMDTDGTVGSGSVIFNTSSERLAKDVRRLVFSLGGISSISKRTSPAKHGHHMAYNVNMRFSGGIEPFRLVRKANRVNSKKLPGLRAIKSIEPSVVDYATCISLDGDHMYFCTENNIITHNSEFCSVNLPMWHLERFPDKHIITATYGSDLANDFAYRVRDAFLTQDNMELLSTRLRVDRKRVDRFVTTQGGSATAVGIGGAITGRGANLFLIDDYIKNHEDALSKTIRDKVWEWFKSTAYTRLEPNATLVILATRWSRDDLIGRCLTELKHENWTVIHLPALALENDVLGRKPGEPLWPERYDVDTLMRIKETLGSFWWDAMFQQTPRGSMSQMNIGGHIRVVAEDDIPHHMFQRRVRSWDLAGTEEAGDYTAGVLMARVRGTAKIFILDMRHARKSPHGVEKLVRLCAEGDGINTRVVMEEEPGSSGKAVTAAYADRVLPEFSFKPMRATGPIEVRAQPFLAACEAGNVYMVKDQWNRGIVTEIDAFPDGNHDDQIAAMAMGYNELMEHKGIGLVWGRGPHQEAMAARSNFAPPPQASGSNVLPFDRVGMEYHKMRRRSGLTW